MGLYDNAVSWLSRTISDVRSVILGTQRHLRAFTTRTVSTGSVATLQIKTAVCGVIYLTCLFSHCPRKVKKLWSFREIVPFLFPQSPRLLFWGCFFCSGCGWLQLHSTILGLVFVWLDCCIIVWLAQWFTLDNSHLSHAQRSKVKRVTRESNGFLFFFVFFIFTRTTLL